jgi:hypothetical protein
VALHGPTAWYLPGGWVRRIGQHGGESLTSTGGWQRKSRHGAGRRCMLKPSRVRCWRVRLSHAGSAVAPSAVRRDQPPGQPWPPLIGMHWVTRGAGSWSAGVQPINGAVASCAAIKTAT